MSVAVLVGFQEAGAGMLCGAHGMVRQILGTFLDAGLMAHGPLLRV